MTSASLLNRRLTGAGVLVAMALASGCVSPNRRSRDEGAQSTTGEQAVSESEEQNPPGCDWPIRAANIAEVAACLDAEAWGSGPLARAVLENEEADVIELLLAAGADVNGQGLTPLWLALWVPELNTAVIDALLAAEPDLDADGALLPAAVSAGPELVSRLIAAGANLEGRGRCTSWHWCWGETAAHQAGRYPDVLEVLIAAGANVNARDGNGLTPLFWTTAAGAELLLAAGADVNARSTGASHPYVQRHGPSAAGAPFPRAMNQVAVTLPGETPLHWAAAYDGSGGKVELLLAAGADVGARGPQDATPLHWAAEYNGSPAVVEALVAAGADVSAKDQFGGTPLHWATEYNRNPAVMEVLMAAGADVNARDSLGKAPLLGAARQRGAIKLPAAGWDMSVRNSDRETLLHNSALADSDDPAVVELLLAAGADVNARDADDETPLHAAAEYSGWMPWPTRPIGTAVVDALLAARASVNARDATGRTPLHFAVEFTHNPAIIEVLLAAGADAGARDEHGETPLDVCCRSAALENVIRDLLQRGSESPEPSTG